MSIKVRTSEGETLAVDGDTWEEYSGVLTVAGVDGADTASFAPGAWLWITKDVEVPEVEPRSWPTLYATPFSARVLDNDGDTYEHRGDGWYWLPASGGEHPLTPNDVRAWGGPLTEIAEPA